MGESVYANAIVVSRVAEKMRSAIEIAIFPDVGHMTMSIGSSAWQPNEPNATAVIQRTDEALYSAKAAGRNCLVAFKESD